MLETLEKHGCNQSGLYQLTGYFRKPGIIRWAAQSCLRTADPCCRVCTTFLYEFRLARYVLFITDNAVSVTRKSLGSHSKNIENEEASFELLTNLTFLFMDSIPNR